MYERAPRGVRPHRRPLQQRRHQSRPTTSRCSRRSLEAWQRVQDVNLRSVFLCCKHGIPHLLEAGRRLGDQHRLLRRRDGRRRLADLLHGLEGRRAVALARARRRVRRAAASASTRSAPARSTRRCSQELFAKDPEKAARRLVHLPMGRFGEPREIAQAALFLASDESSYVTAVDLPGRRRALGRLPDAGPGRGGLAAASRKRRQSARPSSFQARSRRSVSAPQRVRVDADPHRVLVVAVVVDPVLRRRRRQTSAWNWIPQARVADPVGLQADRAAGERHRAGRQRRHS